MTLVSVKPNTKKMREKVAQYGAVWRYVRTLDGKAMIETLEPIHRGAYRYTRWVDANDCDLSPVNLDATAPVK